MRVSVFASLLTRVHVCVSLSQCQALKAVEREPYVGDVALMNSGKKDCGPCDGDTPTRPHTKHGGQRDLHESSFSLSGNTHTSLCNLELYNLHLSL